MSVVCRIKDVAFYFPDQKNRIQNAQNLSVKGTSARKKGSGLIPQIKISAVS